MRLTAGKTEYELPIDFSKVANVFIRVRGKIYSVYEIPLRIPQNVDMSHVERQDKRLKENHPKESIPAGFTIYAPKKRKKKSTVVFIPAPSKNWEVEFNYYSLKQV